jgi:hypothetical protein
MVGEVNGGRYDCRCRILSHPLTAEEFVGFKSALLGEDTPLRFAGLMERVKETFERVKLH